MIRACFIASLLLLFASSSASAQHDHGSATTGSGPPPLYSGLGSLHHKVTTKSLVAQRYFDQGLRLAYAFNHDEAGRAFREAVNMPMSPEAEASAYPLARRAQSLAAKASEPERAYIEALAKRYDAVPGANRAAHDSAYADAMRDAARRYPSDLDAATLCAEALMDLRPWDFWTLDGRPQPGTPEIVSILEGVLKRNPDHIGALHYYIHTVEASPEPARAEPYADRLAKLTPYAGHLVHMPSHIYLRVGRYEDAQVINARAIAADRDYIKKQKVKGIYTVMYYPHNLQMRWSALCSQGRRADAIAAAKDLADAVPDSLIHEMPMAEFFRPSHYLLREGNGARGHGEERGGGRGARQRGRNRRLVPRRRLFQPEPGRGRIPIRGSASHGGDRGPKRQDGRGDPAPPEGGGDSGFAPLRRAAALEPDGSAVPGRGAPRRRAGRRRGGGVPRGSGAVSGGGLVALWADAGPSGPGQDEGGGRRREAVPPRLRPLRRHAPGLALLDPRDRKAGTMGE